MAKNLYKILGVEETATLEEIKRAYRARAKEYHPDVSGSSDAAEKFNECAKAYEVLSNEEKRKHYDETGDDQLLGEMEIERQAVVGLTELFRNLIKESGTRSIYLNLTAEAKRSIDNNLKGKEVSLKGLKEKKEAMEKVRSKFTCQGEMKVFLAALDCDIMALAKQAHKIEHEIVIGKKGLELLDLVSFEPEKRETPYMDLTLGRIWNVTS